MNRCGLALQAGAALGVAVQVLASRRAVIEMPHLLAAVIGIDHCH